MVLPFYRCTIPFPPVFHHIFLHFPLDFIPLDSLTYVLWFQFIRNQKYFFQSADLFYCNHDITRFSVGNDKNGRTADAVRPDFSD